jgi:pimeloyl-ACP methyl ester carboxylesterase
VADWRVVAGRPVRSLVLGVPRPGVPELVVVPGLGALGYLRPTLRACTEWTRVTLVDLPGFGAWRTAFLRADLPTVADVLARWLTDVPRTHVLLLGHSTGAQAALRAAVANPSAVSSLVLAGATFPPDARTVLGAARRAARTLPAERLAELPAVLPEYVRGAPRLPQLLRSSLADTPESHAPRLAVPLLVLRGASDELCPQPWAEHLAALAQHGRTATVPGGHNHVFTFPAETSRAVWTEATRCGGQPRRG